MLSTSDASDLSSVPLGTSAPSERFSRLKTYVFFEAHLLMLDFFVARNQPSGIEFYVFNCLISPTVGRPT